MAAPSHKRAHDSSSSSSSGSGSASSSSHSSHSSSFSSVEEAEGPTPAKLARICALSSSSSSLASSSSVEEDFVNSVDDKLENFLKWCNENEFYISPKVCVEQEGACAQYGMVARQKVRAGEVLIVIPRSSLLSPETSSIAPILKEAQQEMGKEGGWVPLLLALMYEYTDPQSRWRPYLDLVPNFAKLDLPMFWSREEREKELGGTGVDVAVNRDLERLEKDFHTKALPFMKKHSQHFGPACQSLDLYTKMVAFVMAYSFYERSGTQGDDQDSDSDEEEDPLPVMVPMADMLNNEFENNAALTFGAKELKMMSLKEIKKGEEVFNTYGELSNKGLLHMYGFAHCYFVKHHDTVDIPVSLVTEVAQMEYGDTELMNSKLRFLHKLNIHQEGESYVLGETGVLTDEELEAALRVLVMSAEDFKAYEEKDGWSDDEEDEDEDEDGDGDAANPLSFDNIQLAPAGWKKILWRCAEVCLSRLSEHTERDNKAMRTLGERLPPRARYACFVRYGQRELLEKFRDYCA